MQDQLQLLNVIYAGVLFYFKELKRFTICLSTSTWVLCWFIMWTERTCFRFQFSMNKDCNINLTKYVFPLIGKDLNLNLIFSNLFEIFTG